MSGAVADFVQSRRAHALSATWGSWGFWGPSISRRICPTGHMIPALLAGNHASSFKPPARKRRGWGVACAANGGPACLPSGALECVAGGRGDRRASGRASGIDGPLFNRRAPMWQNGCSAAMRITPAKSFALGNGGEQTPSSCTRSEVVRAAAARWSRRASAFISAGHAVPLRAPTESWLKEPRARVSSLRPWRALPVS